MIDEDSDDVCYLCDSDENPEQMMICDLCDFRVAHTYCCGFGNQIPEDDWVCGYCDGTRSEDDDIIDDSEIDDISDGELAFLEMGDGLFNARNRMI